LAPLGGFTQFAPVVRSQNGGLSWEFPRRSEAGPSRRRWSRIWSSALATLNGTDDEVVAGGGEVTVLRGEVKVAPRSLLANARS
jgi:hypothetical protein